MVIKLWKLVSLLAAGCVFSVDGQALNNHINPLWVESGRELLARQQIERAGLGRSTGGSYLPARQSSLFYLDNSGQLRPVFLGSSDPLTSYSRPGFFNGNLGVAGRNLPNSQAIQGTYY